MIDSYGMAIPTTAAMRRQIHTRSRYINNRSKYQPHQNNKEKLRRLKQMHCDSRTNHCGDAGCDVCNKKYLKHIPNYDETNDEF